MFKCIRFQMLLSNFADTFLSLLIVAVAVIIFILKFSILNKYIQSPGNWILRRGQQKLFPWFVRNWARRQFTFYRRFWTLQASIHNRSINQISHQRLRSIFTRMSFMKLPQNSRSDFFGTTTREPKRMQPPPIDRDSLLLKNSASFTSREQPARI